MLEECLFIGVEWMEMPEPESRQGLNGRLNGCRADGDRPAA
jgi:hypothetical protein